ncbi:MAG: aminoglycoside phosphotransferase family protein [Chloroflexota bacterium]|nr:aminoglycoside phosphotransferase family protein [Chloroflexota bacterium]
MAEGRTAEVYAIDKDQVIKLFFEGFPAKHVQQEIDIAREISSLPLATPKIIDSLEFDGRQGIIYERVYGPLMLKASIAKPWRLFRFARQLAELQTEIHKFKGISLPSQGKSIITCIQQLENFPPDLKSRALNLLETLPDGDVLCHLDIHPDQVIIADDGPVIIDWVTAKQGHPHSDVARTCVILKFGQLSYGGWAMRTLANILRSAFYRTYLSCYLELNPATTTDEIIDWMVPVAIARLDENVPGEREPILSFVQSHLSV